MQREPEYDDEYEYYVDPVGGLRYEEEISTRDVADLRRVTPAVVRRWVALGYIRPASKLGASNLFNAEAALVAYDEIRGRRRATGAVGRASRSGTATRAVDRFRTKHQDAVVTPDEAARLVGVSPGTIRSWVHRGHLSPLASSKPSAVRLRLGDVILAADARQLPQPSVRSRGGRRT
jgi:DNA-binding transcriptional MerR regulator